MMRAYINHVWDLIEIVYKCFNIIAISRKFNQRDDSLVISASTFKTLDLPQMRYEIEMRYKPSIHDNIKYWQVFKYYQ
jgi:hypothetical protein